MVLKSAVCWVVAALVVGKAWTTPVSEALPLGLLSEVTPHLGHSSRLQEARLALPSLQDIENIKKVAQILVMLGQQVLPGIIGEPPTSTSSGEPVLAGEQKSNDDDNNEKPNSM